MSIENDIAQLKEQFTPTNAAKFILGTLASLGAAAAVVALMQGPLNGSKGMTKLLMKLGIFVLAGKAGDIAETYLKETLDDAEQAFKEAQKDVKEEMAKNVNNDMP